jgi:hypothetical protein
MSPVMSPLFLFLHESVFLKTHTGLFSCVADLRHGPRAVSCFGATPMVTILQTLRKKQRHSLSEIIDAHLHFVLFSRARHNQSTKPTMMMAEQLQGLGGAAVSSFQVLQSDEANTSSVKF